MSLKDQDISVILVNPNDEVVGYEDKLETHRKGLLHRAFSIFVFNDQGELLIQRRAPSKYHEPGKWANTCCGHPLPGESNEEAASRRLFEELGFVCPLVPLAQIYYKADLANGMVEHEYVHAFKGHYNDDPVRCDPNEVDDIAWIQGEILKQDLELFPHKYAPWFAHYLKNYYEIIFS